MCRTTNKFFYTVCSQQYWRNTPRRWFPILNWLPCYSFEDLKGDFIAGFSVGLTVVPQGLALAHLAGLPAQYGLYTAFMGSFMYAIFGTCKDVVIGPTSVMALMTSQYSQNGGAIYAVLLTFICGCVQLVLGIFNLGFIMNFISPSVLSGFISAAAIITAISQLKGILGLKFKSGSFLSNIYNVFVNIKSTNFYDMGMGITAIIVLLLLKHFKDLKCKKVANRSSNLQSFIKAFWWCFATARIAIVVIVCSLIASAFLSVGLDVFTLTEHVEPGLPSFALPQFSVYTNIPSSNSTVHKSFIHILKELGPGAVVVPFLSLLEAVAIAKVFCRSKKLDSTKEMIALGMGNLFGSFVSSYPVTASFSRTVINNSSGVKTPLGGVFTGCMVLLALGVIAPSFHYIPKSCLSAIIFSAVIFMIHYEDIPVMWKTSKLDLIPFSITFVGSFTLGLEYGLLFGILVSLAMLLYRQNKPHVNVSINKVNKWNTHIHITPDCTVYFPSIEYLKGKINEALYDSKKNSTCKVVIHGNSLIGIDYGTALGIQSLVSSLEKENVSVEFYVTEPAALKALNCLKDSVPFTVSLEEFTEDTAGDSISTKCHKELHETDSVEPLLSEKALKGEVDVVVCDSKYFPKDQCVKVSFNV